MPGRQLAALCLVSVACGFITPTRHAVKPSFDPLRLSKKESTWDRLTGPKLFKTVKRTAGIHAVPLVPLDVRRCLATSEERDRYERLSLNRCIEAEDDLGTCPTAGCPFAFQWDASNRKLECPLCNKSFCL